MATGDITATYVGVGKVGTAAFTALLTGMNVGGANEGASTATIYIIPTGALGEFSIYKLARAA